MIKPINTRIESAVLLLHKSKKYVNQSRKNIDDYRRNKSNTIPLENALTNNRIALEGYYKALMVLHGLTEDDVYMFLDISYCEKNATEDPTRPFRLKFITNPERKSKADLKAKQAFFIDFIGMPAKDVAIVRKARSDGNVGSHFGKNQVKVEAVEEICDATSGLIYGELVYLTAPNINEEEIEQETKRIYTKMAHNLASLQRKSFNQSEINKEILRSYEKNGYNDQAIKKRRTHLENSLNDNLQLTKFRKEYCEICLDLDESDVHRRLDIFKDIYKYIAIQNRSSECGSGLYVEISKLKAQASNCKKEITGVPRCGIAGNTIAFICTVFALLILLMFVLLTIGTATH